MATHSSILAWKIPWTEEPGGLQPMRSQRVRHDWAYINLYALIIDQRDEFLPTTLLTNTAYCLLLNFDFPFMREALLKNKTAGLSVTVSYDFLWPEI